MGKTSISLPDDLEWAFKREATKRRISYTMAIRQAFAAFVERKDISEKIIGESISPHSTDSSVDGSSGDPERLAFHQMLDEILDSGIPKYVTGIEANLEWGSRSTRDTKKGQAIVEGSRDADAPSSPSQRTPEQAKQDAARAIEHANDALRQARGVKPGDRDASKRDAS